MAFKRSAVRSRLSPPEKRGFTVFENGKASFAIWEKIGWFYVRHFVKFDVWSNQYETEDSRQRIDSLHWC